MVSVAVKASPPASAVRSPLPLALTYERWLRLAVHRRRRHRPRQMEAHQQIGVRAARAKSDGIAERLRPGRDSTPVAPAKVSGTGAPRAARARALHRDRRAARSAPGADAKVLSSRIRARGPPAEVCTTSRSVRSVQGPTAV